MLTGVNALAVVSVRKDALLFCQRSLIRGLGKEKLFLFPFLKLSLRNIPSTREKSVRAKQHVRMPVPFILTYWGILSLLQKGSFKRPMSS